MKKELFMKPSRSLRAAIGASVLGLLGVGSVGRADLLYFRKGGDAQLPAKDRGQSSHHRRCPMDRSTSLAILCGSWFRVSGQRLTGRSAAAGAQPADFDAQFAAAWWAIENGLTKEAAVLVRELHRLDPKHAPAARMASALDRLEQPCPDPDFSAFQKALGIEVTVARGPHVILLHQHSEAEASERIAVLEKVITGFYLLFAADGIELLTPRQRLVSAWFADKKDFLAFLHAEQADAFATTRGYFHPTWGAVVAFDARSTEAAAHREAQAGDAA